MDDYNRRHHRDLRYAGLTQPIAGGLTMPLAVPPAGRRLRPSFDADAQAYITTAGELFPDALNTLVVGLKAAGLWDKMGSIQKAIGVSTLSASLIDLKNTAFNSTAVNGPTQSATQGWTFAAASSQYLVAGWHPNEADSKASLNSTHIGVRVKSGGGPGQSLASVFSNPNRLGFYLLSDGVQYNYVNSGNLLDAYVAGTAGRYVISRTAANAQALYKNTSSIASNTGASAAIPTSDFYIAAENNSGFSPHRFFDGRISLFHAGAALDSSEVSAADALFSAYATAAGEA